MAKTENADKECPMEIGLNLLGGRWRLRIMWHLLSGPIRFNELKRRLTPITTRSLARELDVLEEAGIISRTVYPQVPPKVEYSITELGKSIRPVMDTLCAWGRLYAESRYAEKGGKEE